MSDMSVCPTNLNAAGRRRRFVLGGVALVASLVLHFGWPREPGSWRMWVGLLLLVYAWLCLMQAAVNTCVVLAAKGTREVDGGTEPVTDAALGAALKKRAVRVYLLTLLAVIGTVVLLGLLEKFAGL